MTSIKVIDIDRIGLKISKPDLDDQKKIGEELSGCFQDIGFVYVKNHGIDEDVIVLARDVSKKYFQLDQITKVPDEKSGVSDYQGWVKPGKEIFDQDENGRIAKLEVRESYDMGNFGETGKFPDTTVPTFRPAMTTLAEKARQLTFRILPCLSLSLGKEAHFLDSLHQTWTATQLRTIYYPPISEDLACQPGIIRLGEHSDYGTITLLFQDDLGGLEVKGVDGKWVAAEPIPGTVLVNIGDLLEVMTSGAWQATMHRVVVPLEEWRRKAARQSIAVFVDPDPEVVCQPLQGSHPKYPPVKAGEYIQTRYKQTYT